MGDTVKQFISIFLALTVALTSIPLTPTIAYADTGKTLEDSASGKTGKGSVGAGGDWGNDVGKSGIRISLVSADDPSKVVSIDKDGNPAVVDIIFGTEAQYKEYCENYMGRKPIRFSSTKAQELGFQNTIKPLYLTDYLMDLALGDQNKREWYKKLTSEEMAKNVDNPEQVKHDVERLIYDIRWMVNPNKIAQYTLNGEYLRNWLLSNTRGEHVDTGLSVAQTISTKLADGTSKTLAKSTSADKRSSGATNKKSTGKTVIVLTQEQVYGFFKEGLDKAYPKYTGSAVTKIVNWADWDKNRKDCISWRRGTDASLINSLDAGKITHETYLDLKKNVNNIDDLNKRAYNSFCTKENNRERRLNMVEAVFDRLSGTMTVYGAEGTSSDKTETSVGVSEEDAKASYQEQFLNHLSYILQLTDDKNVPYFITKDMLDGQGNIKKTKYGSRDWTVFDSAVEMEHYTEFRIMVEPLDWFTPYNIGNKPVDTYRYYGTLTNIAQAFDSSNVNQKYFNNGRTNGEDSFTHMNRRTFNLLSWCSMTVGDDAQTREDLFNGKFIFDAVPDVVTDYNGQRKVGQQQISNRFLADNSRPVSNPDIEGGRPHQLGWGVQVYWAAPPETFADKGTTATWDGEKIPSPAPPTKDKTLKSLKVAKWYYTEDDNTETVVGVKVQENSNSPIAIKNEDDEENGIIWEVAGWSTGLSDSIPNNNDTSTSYEQYSDNNKGTYAGTEPTILTLEKEDTDKVLYVKLVAKPLSSSTVDIVKVIEKADNSNPSIVVEKDVSLGDGQEYNPTDSRGTYTENIQSEEKSKSITLWDDILDQGLADDGNPIIKERDTNTIYIHYNGGPSSVPDTNGGDGNKNPIILHEDELSYPYTLKSLRKDGTLAYWQEYFESKSGSVRYCSGHDKDDGKGGTKTVYCSYRSRLMEDSYYSLRTVYQNVNPNFITDIAEDSDGAGIGAWTISGFKSISGGSTFRSYPNISFLLFRNKDKDKVTLYPGLNNGTSKSLANSLGISSESYTPAGTRIAKTGTGTFKDTLTSNFVDNGTDRTLGWYWRGSRGCTESGTWDSTAKSGLSLSDVNSAYTFDNNVRELYELGNVGTGTATPGNDVEKNFKAVFKNNLYTNVVKDGDLQFYPYIRMNYVDKSKQKTPVYVTSENLSTVPAYTKVEAGVWKNAQYDASAVDGANPVPNVSIVTNLWTQRGNAAKFIADHGITDRRSVLNGGAEFDVQMSDVNTSGWTLPFDSPKTSTKLGYRIWNVCVDDSQLSTVASGNTAPTLSNAKSRVEAFDKTVKETVPQYGLSQIVSKGIIDYKGYLKNMVFNNSKGYSYVPTADGMWGDIKLSTDNKYYLKLAGMNMGAEFNGTQANFDLIDGGIEQQTVYRVYSDVDGKVMVSENGNVIATLNSTDKDVSKFIMSNDTVRMLDYSTGAVTNYINSIDRQKGANRNGEAWYNEAYAGITVLMSYLSYDIGFGKSIVDSPNDTDSPLNVRMAVLDVRLSGKLDSKGDLYNFKEETADEKVRSTMFVTAKISDTQIPGVKNTGCVVPQEPDGHFGTYTLSNGSTFNIMLPDMKCFAYSKLFYIPNATVSDLDG